ncbi:MAG: helix-turn-helix domain-containing protein [Candidatus Bruticola sp.]
MLIKVFNMDNISKRIKNARKQAGLKQADMAEKVGVSVTSVSLWENGKQVPDFEKIKKIAQVTGLSIDYFSDETPSTSNSCNSDEDFVLEVFRNLNAEGRDHMLKYVRGLQCVPEYKKLDNVAVANI